MSLHRGSPLSRSGPATWTQDLSPMNVHLLDHHMWPHFERQCVLTHLLKSTHLATKSAPAPCAGLSPPLPPPKARNFNTQTHIVARHTHTPTKHTNLPALSFPPTQVLLQAMPPAWKTKKKTIKKTTTTNSSAHLPVTVSGGRAACIRALGLCQESWIKPSLTEFKKCLENTLRHMV